CKTTTGLIQFPGENEQIKKSQRSAVPTLVTQQKLTGQHDHPPSGCERFGGLHEEIRLNTGRRLKILPRTCVYGLRDGVDIDRITVCNVRLYQIVLRDGLHEAENRIGHVAGRNAEMMV